MPETYEQIEYPATGATYSHDEYGVYRYGTYPESSVLAGQESRHFLGSYATLAEAKENHPNAKWGGEGSGFSEPVIPEQAPEWFDPANAGETWSEKDAY